MWWEIETVTTVGYDDVIPSQTAGKVIAGVLMLGGLSLLSVVTAAITSGFVSRAEDRRRATGEDPVMQRLDQLTAQLDAVRTELELRRAAGTPPDTAPGSSGGALNSPTADPE